MLPKSFATQNSKVFSAYTPFRNYLRKMDMVSSLRALHAHAQFMQFGQQLPPYITNVPPGYSNAKDATDFLNYHLFPWELEVIAKEVIINSPIFGQKQSLENWNHIAGAVNKLKSLEDEIMGIYLTNENLFTEMHRVAHRQFRWQRRPNFEDLARYWVIYSNPELQKVIYKAVGLTVDEIYLIGLSLTGIYLSKFALFYPPNIQVKHFSIEHLDKFLKHFCLNIDKLTDKLRYEQEINEKYAYAYNSLKAYPLIRIEYENRDAIICPLPTLLFYRITEGLYYEICNEAGFDSAFGNSFQDFIGELLKTGNTGAKTLPEEIYGHPQKRTVDWLTIDDNSILFVECKSKRLTLEAKTSLTNDEELMKQLDIMASFVIQVYKSILDYKKGLYPQLPYDKTKKMYPLIVTLEEWYIFGDKVLKELDKKIRNMLTELGIPLSILKESPYSICSVEGLNLLIQVSEKVGIDTILDGKNSNNEYKMWQLDSFIYDKHKDQLPHIKSLFKNKLDSFMASAGA